SDAGIVGLKSEGSETPESNIDVRSEASDVGGPVDKGADTVVQDTQSDTSFAGLAKLIVKPSVPGEYRVVLRMLLAQPDMSMTELYRATGIPEHELRIYIAALQEKG